MARTLIRKNPSNFKTLALHVEASADGLSYQGVGMPQNFSQTLQRRKAIQLPDTERFVVELANLGVSVRLTLNWQGRDYWVLVHSDGNDLHILEQEAVYETLAALKQEGKILGYGFSGKTVAGGLKALQQGDCAMVTYNLNEQAERPVLDYAAEHGKAILVKKALASGHACLAPGIDPVQASFELLFAHPGVHSAIVGTINPVHLAHNVATVARILGRR